MTRIGIVGTGSIGRVHAKHAARVGLPVAAAWDPSDEAVEAFRAEHPAVDHEPSLESLLSRRDIEGVVIAVPNDLHEPLAVQALQAGKHVLLEKPMATSAVACDRILAAASRAGRQVQMGFVCRRLPAVEMATGLRAAVASAASTTRRPACIAVEACPALAGGSPRGRDRAAGP